MRTIEQAGDVAGKKILFRTDFDVPLSPDGRIQELFRIQKQIPAIRGVLDAGASVVLVAHASACESFAAMLPELAQIIGEPLELLADVSAIREFLLRGGKLGLLENVRSFQGETENGEAFARELAQGFDFYMNNAFAVCHRAHASVSAIAQILPSYAGPLVAEEVARLSEAVHAPAAGKVIVMGGAKASTKIPVIRRFLDRAEAILVGGVIATDILRERGQDVGASRIDEDAHELLSGVDVFDPRIIVPSDFILDGGRFVDIGSASGASFAQRIATAQCIIWNGPMGIAEDERFRAGTEAVARAIAQSSVRSIIGGGDTIAAVNALGLLDAFGYVSTGGGAMLAFLAGEELPGLAALGYTAG